MSELVTRHKIDLKDKQFQEAKRDFKVERDGIDKEARTVELSFASGQPVDRWFGREVLEISEDACDMSRLKDGGAVLVNHDWDSQVGVVLKSWVDATTKKARCLVKFSRSEAGEEIFQDIVDGIRSLVSVGYIVRKMVLQSVEGDVETHRVTDWLPYEVSIVSVPADTSVGVGRSQPKEEKKPATEPAATIETKTNSRKMSDENKTTVTTTVDFSAERQRVADLNKTASQLATRHPQHKESFFELARKCAETGDTVDAFNRTVLADILKTEPATPATRQGDAKAGLNEKDTRRYSVGRAIRLAMEGKSIDGLEGECNAELTRKLERQPKGFFLPDEVVARDYRDMKRGERANYAGNGPDGGYTVGNDILASEFVEFLRNNAVVAGLGARYISGLVGDVTIPRQVTGASAYWVSETGSITQSSATFGQIVGKPRRVGTSVPYSKQFLAQSSLSAESFITSDSDAAIALELDRVALRGIGGAEPLGIANMATADRSTSVTFGAAPTWAKYLEFMSSVAASNSLTGSPAYVASVASAVKAMTVPKFTSGVEGIWVNDMVGTFRAKWTTQLLTSATPVANMVIFGDWSQVLYLEWAGRDVVVDPYSGKKEGTVEVTIQRLIDVVIRRGKSFAISSDSGAQ